MKELAQYILTVTVAAMLAAILQSLVGKGSMAALVKLTGGIFLVLTMLSPLIRWNLPDLDHWLTGLTADGKTLVADGTAMAAAARENIITQQVEAYIQDKASVYQAVLEVEVALDEAGCPVSARLTGDISPYGKMRLSRMMEEELGIGEEAQLWQ